MPPAIPSSTAPGISIEILTLISQGIPQVILWTSTRDSWWNSFLGYSRDFFFDFFRDSLTDVSQDCTKDSFRIRIPWPLSGISPGMPSLISTGNLSVFLSQIIFETASGIPSGLFLIFLPGFLSGIPGITSLVLLGFHLLIYTEICLTDNSRDCFRDSFRTPWGFSWVSFRDFFRVPFSQNSSIDSL